MNYDYRYGTSVPMEKQIENIIDLCDKLDAEETITVFDYGYNGDLVLNIYKDPDYDRTISEDDWNLVTIVTCQNGKAVDDTEDTYVTDGALYDELERIWNYRDFGTL